MAKLSETEAIHVPIGLKASIFHRKKNGQGAAFINL